MASITGMGVQCSVAHDVTEFDEALSAGRSGITFETPSPGLPGSLGLRARLPHSPEAVWKELAATGRPAGVDAAVRDRARVLLRGVSRPVGYSLLAAIEAYARAGLGRVADRRRIALVVGGSNLSQDLSFRVSETFRSEPNYVSPRYAHQFWDTDVLGVVSEALDLHGEGVTTGGASAAGNVGLIQAMRLLRSGDADACVVIGGMQGLSDVELMAFANLGALAVPRSSIEPSSSSRPFDAAHQGFVFGEGAGAVVLEAGPAARGAETLAVLREGVTALDGHHLTQPSQDGQEYVMREVLRRAGVRTDEIDLVSAHATSTPLGDGVESAAIGAVFAGSSRRPVVNATKSLLGHCLGAASMIEAIACVLQMRGGYIHPNANLTEPITAGLNFAPPVRTPATIRYALSNSFGFGGINTSVLLQSAADGKA